MSNESSPTAPRAEGGGGERHGRSWRQPTSPHAEGGGVEAPRTTAPCPARCPTDFEIDAPCRIIKAPDGPRPGGCIHISASESRGFPEGTYEWHTGSPKIRFLDGGTETDRVTARTVTVKAIATPSDPAAPGDPDQGELIRVTRTADRCSPVVKSVSVRVAKVTFSKSQFQRYGYDDFDTPDDPTDDHVCVKKSDHTFVHVTIEGGVVGTDFDFVCDDRSICRPADPEGSASFDLRLNARSTNKASTVLHAKCKCQHPTSFASIGVHVYKERVAQVVVAKIGTNLRYPKANYAEHEDLQNKKLKVAVAKCELSNYESDNSITRVHYDLDGDRALSYDIRAGGGQELEAIARAFRVRGSTTIRVAIVRYMKSYYYLREEITQSMIDSPGGVTSFRLRNVSASDQVFLSPGGSPYTLGIVEQRREPVTVTSVDDDGTVNCGALRNPHPRDEPLEFPAGGWCSDPIVIVEGDIVDVPVIKWTITHEVGHREEALYLADIIDETNIMHWQQALDYGDEDNQLRYIPRLKNYPPGTTETQNQWDSIPREDT